jgi:hypothetical protein
MRQHPSLFAAVAALRAARPVRSVSVFAIEGEVVVVTASRLPPHDATLTDATDHSCVRF